MANKTKLYKWYRMSAVIYNCPHCGFENDLELIKHPDAPISIDDTHNCLACKKLVRFDGDTTDYE